MFQTKVLTASILLKLLSDVGFSALVKIMS